ncbi:hypothetical protein HHK36_003545 [Tetracentron sinense]|uniref:RING-type E3 ubiquitin transferase n=1 Tax=Tetracentron sinense TaxID=13715 RepID=A0A834ZXW8_TETSI|nr:hypothetical protein HHK36_003545 [Tetracentron sinense]
MGQRNMICTNQMLLDMEIDQQGQGHPLPAGILLGNITDLPHPNIHAGLSPLRNTSNLDLHRIPDRHESAIFYGTQYNNLQHHPHPVANLDLVGGSIASNFYNPYVMPSVGSRMCPVLLNHGSSDQLPSSSNNGITGVGVDNYGGNNPFIDGVRGSCKTKNAEGIPGNHQYINGSASLSSSSSGAPLNTMLCQLEDHLQSGVAVLDAVAFAPTGHAWVDQQFLSNGGEGNTPIWNYVPALPYFLGSSFYGGSSVNGSVAGRGYQETANSRNSTILLNPSMHHFNHHHYHPPPPRQGMRGHNFNYHTQVPTSSNRHPTNSTLLHHGTMNPSRGGLETGPRYSRPSPPTGLRIYRPHRSGVPQATSGEGNHPRLRFLPEEEVAILDFPGSYEVGNLVDHHRDLRLDVEHMSYEELLALEERIGNVNTGFSEETIIRQLKTKTYVSPAPHFNLEESAAIDEETDICIICQIEYKNQEKIGMLKCGHEYHADCIKKWLLVKNVCPICKITALSEESQDE